MSFEDDIKHAFQRHEDDVAASPHAWAGVERGVRRTHARRLATTGAIALAAVVAAVAIPFALTRGGDQPGGFANPNATTPAQPTPTTGAQVPVDTSGWSPRVAAIDGFSMRVPTDWRGGVFEGSWEFHPASLPSPEEGGDTYFVAVAGDGGILQYPCGNGLDRCDERARSGGQSTWVRMQLDPVGTRVVVHISGSNADLVSRYGDQADAFLGTLAGYDGSTPIHGTLQPGTVVNSYTRYLVRFLDARVEQDPNTSSMICCAAEGFYGGADNQLFARNGAPLTSYEVGNGGEHSASAAQTRTGVALAFGPGAPTPETGEFITVLYESGREGSGALKIGDGCTGCDAGP